MQLNTPQSKMDILNLRSQVNSLYYSAQFKEVINLVEAIKFDKYAKQYEGLAFFQLSEFNRGREIFEQILCINEANVCTIDVISFILYISQIYYDRFYLNEKLLHRFNALLEKYYVQKHDRVPSYIVIEENSIEECMDEERPIVTILDISNKQQLEDSNKNNVDQQFDKNIYHWGKAMLLLLDSQLSLLNTESNIKKQWESFHLMEKIYINIPAYKQELFLLLASIMSILSRDENAVYINKKVLDINPTNFEAISNQGYYYNKISEKMNKDAQELKKLNYQIDEKKAKEYEQDYLKQAFDWYKKARMLNPFNIVNLMNLSLSAQQLGQKDMATELCQEIIKLQPQNEKGYILQSQLHYLNFDSKKSISALVDNIDKCNNKSIDIYLQLMQCEKSGLAFEKSLQVAESIKAMYSEYKGDIIYYIAKILHQDQNEYEKGFDLYLQSLMENRINVSDKNIFYSLFKASSHSQVHFQKTLSFILNFLNQQSLNKMTQLDIQEITCVINKLPLINMNVFFQIVQFIETNNQYALTISRFFNRKEIPNLFLEILNMRRNQLTLLAYNKNLSQEMIFQPMQILWDLYLE